MSNKEKDQLLNSCSQFLEIHQVQGVKLSQDPKPDHFVEGDPRADTAADLLRRGGGLQIMDR